MFSLFVKNNKFFSPRLITSSMIAVLLYIAFIVTSNTTAAATLTPFPSSGSYTVGQTFTVSFYANSSDQSANAVSGGFTYSGELEIVSFSKSSSIFSIWTQEPSYSNTTGTGLFEGIILNPGFTGTNGKLVTFTFRVKKSGTGTIKLINSSILANDGNGTNILTSTGSASFTLLSAPNKPEPNLTTDKSKNKTPGTTTELENKPVNTSLGFLEIIELPKKQPTAQFKISLKNSKEVVKKYEIRIDQMDSILWEDTTGTGIFTAPLLKSGNHTLLVKAIDKVNTYNGYIDFTIDATLTKPKIVSYTKYVNMLRNPLVVYGTSNQDTEVTISIILKNTTDDSGIEITKTVLVEREITTTSTVKVDAQGNFIFILDKNLIPGDYAMTISSSNSEGLTSEATSPVTVSIKRYPFIDLGFMTISMLTLITFCGLLLIITSVLIIYFYIKLRMIEKIASHHI